MTETAAKTLVETYNLSNKKGRDSACAALDAEADRLNQEDNGDRIVKQIGDLQTYVTTGVAELVYRDTVIVEANENRLAIKNGAIYSMPSGGWESESLRDLAGDPKLIAKRVKGALSNSYFAEGVVLPTPLPTNQEGAVLTILQNGDEDANTLVDDLSGFNFPTVSFRCLGRFYDEENDNKGVDLMLKAIASGDLRVLDFTPDETRTMSDEYGKLVAAWNKYNDSIRFSGSTRVKKPTEPMPQPPERVFSLVGNNWHRAATVLFYDKAKRMTVILGQDEGSYFGCEIANGPKTVADAFTALIPKDLREMGDLTRQGEWFFVPVDEEEVPSVVESIIHLEDFALPVDHIDSSQHAVHCDDGRMSKNGSIYAYNPDMSHPDHATTKMMGWYTFRLNTAKRSFSEAGVD